MTTAVTDAGTATAEDADSTTPGRRVRLGERIRSFGSSVEAPSRAVLAFSALLTIVSWHLPAFPPTEPRGDHDYGLVVAIAHQLGLSFGDRIATTYGPLYFLAIPSIISRGEVFVAYLVWFVFMTGCLAALVQGLRRHLSQTWAWVAGTLVALSFSITPLTAVITATFGFTVILSVLYLRGELPRWAQRAFPIAMGLLVAAMLLTKFSVGLMCGPVALGAILAGRERVLRSFVEYAIAGVVGLELLWIIAGQPPVQIVQYVVRALSVGGGHAEAMGYERADRMWEYPLLAGLVLIIGIGALTLKAGGRRRWLFWLGLALGAFLMFKQGFVRHDSHSAQFFAPLFALGLVLAAIRRSAVLACAAVVALLVQTSSFGGGLWVIDPARGVRQLAEGVTVVASEGHRDVLLANSRAELAGQLQVPQRFLSTIGTASVRAESFDFTISWTYGLKPDILPTILNYGAYTQLLDELDAKWVADDATGPDYIIRESSRGTVDSRFPLWDPPRTQLAQACRYELVDATPRWLLLHRTADRCGPERPLGEVTARAGEAIPVPPAGNGIVVARVYPEWSVAQRLKTLLFRSDELWVSIDGEPHRVPVSHGGAPLMVSAPADDKSLELDHGPLSTKELTMNVPGRVVFSVVETR